ncbi:DUF1890 family protein [Methanocaldococcus indicus]|uniref:DUF1890 family protein n=1 Tax=Methanocaldococcus indicus TaxID=213231 RepID=UPI003C6D7641
MILVIVGCPEPPLLIPSTLYLISQLKKENKEIVIAANFSAIKLLDIADIDKYYLSNVGVVNIDKGLKIIKELNIDKIISFVNKDSEVSYTITYKELLNVDTYAIVFGKSINEDFIKTLEEHNIKVYSARAYHNPMPIVNIIDKIVLEL